MEQKMVKDASIKGNSTVTVRMSRTVENLKLWFIREWIVGLQDSYLIGE